jgi:hypothetical protein
MALDFQQVRDQVLKLGEKAPERAVEIQRLRDQASSLLAKQAAHLDKLRAKVERAVSENNRLRCAVPTDEALDAHFPMPPAMSDCLIIAADGSQINPDWHSQVHYGLVNVGAISMRVGRTDAPRPDVFSELFYDDQLYTGGGTISESMVALIRDESERSVLAELAERAGETAITITDGPIELWNDSETSAEFGERFAKYLDALRRLHKLDSITAGYVDRPRSDLVVRLLEIALLDDAMLSQAGKQRMLPGVRDADLFFPLLGPGERSAMFAIQSKSSNLYADELALHFFYLNPSLDEKYPWIVRVEIPAWVANDADKLNDLHAMLVAQCQILSDKPFPYLLHRAHETALVSRKEKEQVDEMIALELRKRGVSVPGKSYKQHHKDNK